MNGARSWRRIAWAGWALMALLSAVIAIYGFLHILRLVVRLQNFEPSFTPDVPILLIAHLLVVASALLAGPWQFLPKTRRRWPHVHRWTGRLYVLFALAGGASGLILSMQAVGTAGGRAGFALLALAWMLTTGRGYLLGRRRAFEGHRRWMTRSFALAFSAVTLRLYYPLLIWLSGDFAVAQQWGAWLCWVPNLLIAELLLSPSRRRSYAASALT